MNKTFITFSNDAQVAFKDYMYHYLTESQKRKGFENYDRTMSFSDKEKKINNVLMKQVERLSGIKFSENSDISNEMMSANPMVGWATMAVVNSMVDMIIPDVMDKTIGMYTETRMIGMGASAQFDVKPNELFVVSKAGRDQRTVEFQRQYSGTVTVTPENRAITVAVNLYRTLCGIDSLAELIMKAILSIEAQITREVYTAFDTAMSDLPDTPEAAALKVAGYEKKAVISLAQRVSALNNTSPAVFVGTKLALSDILPDNANYRYDFDSPYVKVGYLANAFGYDTLELPQVLKSDNSMELALKDDRFYVLSPSSQKIVKLVYEGSSMTNPRDFYMAADLTGTTTINKSWGMAIATNASAGIVTLA